MKIVEKIVVALILVSVGICAYAGTVNDFIQRADSLNQAGNLDQAIALMQKAVESFPDEALAYSYLGLYLGSAAGETRNFMKAGKLIETSFQMLDKSVEMAPDDPRVRFNRGIISVKVPNFMGKLATGVQDFEHILEMYAAVPGEKLAGLVPPSYDFLAEAYLKQDQKEQAVVAWQKIIEMAPGSPLAESAQMHLGKLMTPAVQKEAQVERPKLSAADVAKLKQAVQEEPDNALLYLRLGQAYTDVNDYKAAYKVLQKSLAIDSTNVDTYLLLTQVVGELANVGYDERIYDNRELRTNLAFEIVEITEKAVAVAPDNMQALLNRGVTGIMMPFFVGKLDDAIADLEAVRQSNASDEIIAEATYWLGYAYQKKATTLWIDVVKNYSATGASQNAFETMRPAVSHLDPDEYERPIVAIDFILGFKDELEPQTVVWIETESGDFVKTIYISGFSGYAKEMQINLPKWSQKSNFADVDGVTGASIDLGQHIYVWDLKDRNGQVVTKGNYMVWVEVSYWPSMEYQIVSTPISIGKKNTKSVVEEGNLIPYLEVNYIRK
jgi:tetratricopeptide (TPR) repeat protein